MRLVTLLAAVSVSACAHRIECEVHGGPVWRELRTQHFEVLTDLPIEIAREEALNLEQMRLAIRWHFGLPAEADDFSKVIYLADPDELHEFTRVDGFARPAQVPEDSFLVSIWEKPNSRRRSNVIPHELTHRVSANVFPKTARWIEEGTAGYLETMALEGPWKIKFGRPGDRFGRSGDTRSLEELWAMPYPTDTTPEISETYYESSWAWVHYLVNHEPEKWDQFIATLKAGGPPRTLFAAVFPESAWPALAKKVNLHRREATFRARLVDVRYQRVIMQETAVPPWRVHLLRRTLASTSEKIADDQRPAALMQEAETARAVAPTPIPWEVEDAFASSVAERLEIADKHPESYGAHVVIASNRSQAPDAEMRVARAAVDLEPNSPSGLLYLGLALIQARDLPAARAAIQRSEALAPWAFQSAVGMARLTAAEGECVEVINWLDRAALIGGQDAVHFLLEESERLTTRCARVSGRR